MGLLRGLSRKISHGMGVNAADATIAGAGGGVVGAMNSLDDPENLGGNMLGGAALGAGALGMQRAVMMLARQLKQARPDVPDEQIMRAAEEAVRRGGVNNG